MGKTVLNKLGKTLGYAALAGEVLTTGIMIVFSAGLWGRKRAGKSMNQSI